MTGDFFSAPEKEVNEGHAPEILNYLPELDFKSKLDQKTVDLLEKGISLEGKVSTFLSKIILFVF